MTSLSETVLRKMMEDNERDANRYRALCSVCMHMYSNNCTKENHEEFIAEIGEEIADYEVTLYHYGKHGLTPPQSSIGNFFDTLIATYEAHYKS